MIYKPWPYQRRMRRFLLEHPRAIEFIDMGMGKTVVMLTAISDLVAGLEIRSALVVAPINVVENTWPDEQRQWDHLAHLKLAVVRGSPAQRLAILRRPADIYLINYELLAWLSEVTAKKPVPFDMIVFDESSKMKSHAAKRFKKIKPLLPRMQRRVIMTGTPTPNNYLDLFSQVFLVDGGERFGPFFTHFRQRYFDFNEWTYACTIKPGAAKAIRKLIRPITLCMRSEDYLALPPVMYHNVTIRLPPAVMRQYAELEKEMFLQLERGEVEAMNAAALTNKCRQFTSGVVYDEEQKEHVIHDHKLDALADIIDDMGGKSLLVVYEFRSELKRMLARWPGTPWIGGGSKDKSGVIKLWNARKAPLVFVHPQSVGHGLNLQHGGHHMVWTSMTWALELYQQMVKRLHRQGQGHPTVVTHLVAAGTVDDAVLGVLREKARGQAALLRRLRALRLQR